MKNLETSQLNLSDQRVDRVVRHVRHVWII